MKRILSFVLSVAMLIGLLPGISTASAQAAQSLSFAFDVNAIADESIISSGSVQVNLVTDTSKLKSDVSTGLWTHYATVGFNTAALYKGGSQMRVNPAYIGKNGLVLKTTFAKAGTYEASVSFNKSTANGRTIIYLVPVAYATEKQWDMATVDGINAAIADNANASSPVELAASVDMHQNATDASPFTGNTVNITAGDYYILLTVSDDSVKGESDRYFTMISALRLAEKTQAVAVESPKYVFTTKTFGQSATFSASNSLTYPFDQSVSSGVYSWVSSQNIATANIMSGGVSFYTANYTPSKDNALIFKLKVDNDGSYQPVIEYSKQAYQGLLDMYLVKTDYAATKGWNTFDKSTIASMMSAIAAEGSMDNSAANVKHIASVDQNTNASANATNELAEKLDLTAGEYYLYLTISKGECENTVHSNPRMYGHLKTLEFVKLAEEEEEAPTESFTFKFYKGGRSGASTDWLEKISCNGELGAEDATYTIYPNDEYTSYPTSSDNAGDMWAYVGSTFGNGWGRINATSKVGVQIDFAAFLGVGSLAADEWAAFRFKVPVTSKYKISGLSAYKYKNASGGVELYVLPYEGAIKETLENSATYGTAGVYTAVSGENTYYYGRKNDAKTFAELGISADNRVATTSLYAAAAVTEDAALENNEKFDLKKNSEYVLIIRAKSKGAATVKTLTLSYEIPDPPVFDEIAASFDDVYVGMKVVPTVTWLSKGEEMDGKGGEVALELIKNDDGAIIEAADGSFYTAKEGKATFRVSGTLGKVTKTCEVEINILTDDSWSGADESFRFYSGAYGNEIYSVAIGGATPGTELTKDIFLTSSAIDYGTERKWAFVSAKASRPNSSGTYFAQHKMYMDLAGNAGEWTAFKVKLPKPGKYSIDFSAYVYKNGGLARVYMLPFDAETMTYDELYGNSAKYMSADNLVAEADTEGTAAAPSLIPNAGVLEVSDELDFSEGYAEYLMIIESARNKNGKYVVMPYSIDFIGHPALADVKLSLSENEIGIGESATIESVIGMNSLGSEIDISEAYIEHKVAEGSEDIIELSEDGLTITGKSEGIGVIETLAISNGSLVKSRTEIDINDSIRVIAAYIYNEKEYKTGDELSIISRLELKNRRIVTGGEIVGYEVVSSEPEGVVSVSEDGKLAKVEKVGTATIRAKVLARGNVIDSDTVTITAGEAAYPANFMIDLRKGAYDGDNFTSLDQITEYSTSRNWKFHSFVEANTTYTPVKLDTAGTFAQFVWNSSVINKENGYVAFKVIFPSDGLYTVDTVGYSRNRAACLEMYVIPTSKENGTAILSKLARGNEYYFGTADCYRAAAGYNELTSFGVKEISEAGEYFVVFKPVKGKAATETTSYGDAWYPLYISFTNGNAMASAELSYDKASLFIGEETVPILEIFDGSGDLIEEGPETVMWKSSDTSVATVSEDGTVIGVSEGSAKISATVTSDGKTVTATCDIKVEDTSGVNTERGLLISGSDSMYVYESAIFGVTAEMNSGRIVQVPAELITWTADSDDIIEIGDAGKMLAKKTGSVVLNATVDAEWLENKGIPGMGVKPMTVEVVWDATVNPAIFTLRERENVKKNAARYEWAREKVKSAVVTADKYVDKVDQIYDMVVPEGLPRYYHVGHKYDPKKFYCRYCGCNIGLEYGSYGWAMSPLTIRWKISCPDCKRDFPSNDFEGFYKLGLTESGSWNYEQALSRHHEMFVCENGSECACENAPHPTNDRMTETWIEYYGFGKGFLENELYKEMDTKLGVVGWGVDDSLGYKQPYISRERAAEIAGEGGDINSVPGYDTRYYKGADGYAYYKDGATTGPVQHTYIAYYVHESIWYGAGGHANGYVLKRALTAFKEAFVYTGEAKYGRAGAILLDKIADVYPDFEWYQWASWRGDSYRGKEVDPVWSTGQASIYAEAFDAFLPIYNDPYVVNYLSKKSPRYEVAEDGNWKRDKNGELIPVNLKDSPGALRKHVEDNILLEIFDATRKGKIWGNFGMHQKSVVSAALALNRLPETGEMLDWVMRNGTGYNTGPEQAKLIAGGYVMTQLINQVDRDGHGNENAPGYNNGWINNLSSVAELLAGYELYPSADLYKNPKFLKMFLAQARLTLGGYYAAQTGDSGAVGSTGIVFGFQPSISLYQVTKDRELARAIYMAKDTKGSIRGTIYDDEPEIEDEIKKIVEEDGRYSLGSDMMTGYGFAALRAGAYYESASAITRDDTNRDFAVYFGANNAHGHSDTLNLYMSAFGLNVAPDLGYPEQTGSQPNRLEWVQATISHNTVIVDEKTQNEQGNTGTSHHFDDSGRVKLLDVESAHVYSKIEEYRRTVMMIEASDDISYGVDFFHVKGGNDHLYSFHSQSDELSVVSGLDDLEVTPMYKDEDGSLYGTYAGPDVKYGADPGGVNSGIYPNGYTWLRNIRTYKSIDKDFSVEFNVKDWRNVMTKKRDVRLRLTMLNDEPLQEVTFASALPPQTVNNKGIGELDYLLARRKGNDLDTVFMTVLEPYEAGNKYIEKIEKLSMERAAGQKPGLNDAFGALRVTLKNGRSDIIIYATNNEVDYIVDERIIFRGFAGVMSLENVEGEEKIIYTYLNDGEVLKFIEDESEEEAIAAYTGKVKSFTRDFAMKNYITYTPDEGEEVDVEALAGKYVYVANDGIDNGAYKIFGAEKSGDDIVLDLGDVTLIRSYVDADNMDRGYNYNIAVGQKLRIPLPATTDSSPVFDEVGDYTATVGGTIRIPINVESPIGKDITLIGASLPRGMTISDDGKSVTWKPDSSQVGKNHIAITASDGTLETTIHFTVEVYGSTGGGGGGSSAPSKPTETPAIPATKPDDKDNTAGSSDNVGTGVPDGTQTPSTDKTGSTVRFIDLGNHVWAADAINALADDGIIKGTSENTFSPAANITRADFAILLVRAFKLASESEENFADVQSSDYFAKELAVARNTGLVNGIGDNKFAPRNNITRQDMMVIVYRAMKDSFEELTTDEIDEILSKYPDCEDVADYAREAVAYLIKAGLINGVTGKMGLTSYIGGGLNTTRAEVAVLIKRILDYKA